MGPGLSHGRLNGASTARCYPSPTIRNGRAATRPVIDAFALGISHFLLAVMAFRLLSRPELDREDPPERERKR